MLQPAVHRPTLQSDSLARATLYTGLASASCFFSLWRCWPVCAVTKVVSLANDLRLICCIAGPPALLLLRMTDGLLEQLCIVCLHAVDEGGPLLQGRLTVGHNGVSLHVVDRGGPLLLSSMCCPGHRAKLLQAEWPSNSAQCGGLRLIGGGSPLRKITDDQTNALKDVNILK